MTEITGAFPSEEKDRCKVFLNGKYVPHEIFAVHMTPTGKTIKVEVITTDGGKHYHRLKQKPCGTYEEFPLGGNDR